MQHSTAVMQLSVQKVGLVLSESNGVAIIETCQLIRNQSGNRDATQTSSGVDVRRLQMMENMIRTTQQQTINLQNTLVREFEAHSTILRRMERLQRRMYAVPARATRVVGEKTVIEDVGEGENHRVNGGMQNNNRANGSNIVKKDLLSSCPKDLHILWREYQFGLDGRKPAKQFTSAERGLVSSIYSKRHKVWKLIDELIHKRGEDYRVVIDSIYAAYGHVSVTDIIKNIQRDEKTGGHPNLR